MSFPLRSLGQIAQIIGGKRLPVGHAELQELKTHQFIRAGDIGEGRIASTNPVYVSNSVLHELKGHTVKTQDICLTTVGSNVGAVGLVPPSLHGAPLTENAAMLTDIRKDCDPQFLTYALLGPKAQDQMKKLATGTVKSKLGLYKIPQVQVPFPDLATQQKIASVLGPYDQLIDNNTRRIALLDEITQRTYQEWFLHWRLPGSKETLHKKAPHRKIPKGWKLGRLGDVLQIRYGKELSRQQMTEGGTYPVYGASGVMGFTDKCVVRAPICLVPCRGKGSGSVQRTKGASFVTSNVFLVTPQTEFSYWPPFFVEVFLQHVNLQKVLSGWAQLQLTVEDLSRMEVLIPAEHVVQKFCQRMQDTVALTDNLESKNTILRKTRNLLLPMLISGEVDMSSLKTRLKKRKEAA